MIDFNLIKKTVENKKIKFRKHSAEKLIERNISRKTAYNVILNGEIIEEYPNDKPFESCLIFGMDTDRPIHICCAYNNIDDCVVIITTYVPDEIIFEKDYKTRRKK